MERALPFRSRRENAYGIAHQPPPGGFFRMNLKPGFKAGHFVYSGNLAGDRVLMRLREINRETIHNIPIYFELKTSVP